MNLKAAPIRSFPFRSGIPARRGQETVGCRGALPLLGALIFGAALAGTIEAADGDILSTHTGLSNLNASDLTRDPTTGNFWVASQSTGKIYRLSDSFAVLGDIPNPHGVGEILKPILTRGITFRPAAGSTCSTVADGTLLVMAVNSGQFKVKEISRASGAEVAPEFTLAPPNAQSADLHGLAWDCINNQLWCLDDANDLLIRFNMAGVAIASFPIPGDVPPETRLSGRGISFQIDGVTGFIHITHGDIFTLGPSKVLRLTLNGFSTGAFTPIPSSIGPDVRGIVVTQLNAKNVIVAIGNEPSSPAATNLYVIEREIPDPVPPSDLRCFINSANQVTLQWKNNGTGNGGAYPGGIQVFRDGLPLSTIAGSATSFIDSNPIPGPISYCLKGSNTGKFSRSVCCEVTSGKGGLIRWRPFPGKKILDLCQNPTNGDVFATDQTAGLIYHFDSNLALLGTLPSPWPRPGGIAFIPTGDEGRGSLMVVNSDGVLMRQISLAGAPLDSGIPMNPPSGASVTGGLTYNPETTEFVYVDVPRGRLVFINKNGILLRTEGPPQLFSGPLGLGVAFHQLSGNYYATFDGGKVVRETLSTGCAGSPPSPPPNCNFAVSDFSFELNALGATLTLPDSINGVEVSRNTLLVSGAAANAIFQVLIAPEGQPFVRGDADNSGQLDISDAVLIADYLFRGGSRPWCQDAADANDDGSIDVSDPVYSLFFLFLGGPPPPMPYPARGNDPTFLDDLEC